MHRLPSFACRCAVLALSWLALAPSQALAGKVALVPAPASLEAREGVFAVDAHTRVLALDAQSLAAARHFSQYLAQAHGPRLRVAQARSEGTGAIHFRIDPQAAGNGPESYTLEVEPRRVVASARDPRGLFYGATTLWQLLVPAGATPQEIPALRIQD